MLLWFDDTHNKLFFVLCCWLWFADVLLCSNVVSNSCAVELWFAVVLLCFNVVPNCCAVELWFSVVLLCFNVVSNCCAVELWFAVVLLYFIAVVLYVCIFYLFLLKLSNAILEVSLIPTALNICLSCKPGI